ncbi:unnamed protein product [Amoebophrya sp. A120]|nr:unnamed protein product [Amoebophrya sp. A120]|eukprot:GSA120T00014785001.1
MWLDVRPAVFELRGRKTRRRNSSRRGSDGVEQITKMVGGSGLTTTTSRIMTTAIMAFFCSSSSKFQLSLCAGTVAPCRVANFFAVLQRLMLIVFFLPIATYLQQVAHAAEPIAPVRAPTDCWAGGWTPEICCSSPGAQGNPLCWDHIYTYEKCCTDTIEGQRFHHQRLLFIEDMVARGAKVDFEIRQIEGTGRSGAVNAANTAMKRSTASRSSIAGAGGSTKTTGSKTGRISGSSLDAGVGSSDHSGGASTSLGTNELATVPRGQEILRVPVNQTYGLRDLPPALTKGFEEIISASSSPMVVQKNNEESSSPSPTTCDAHAMLALGLVDEEQKGERSRFFKWIQLLPKNFANVLWFSEDQRTLVNQTFFNYILNDWDTQIECMEQVYKKVYGAAKFQKKADKARIRFTLKWAFSIVKTRGFAFDTSRNSTLLIPLADFLNHHPKANVRTPDPLPDATSEEKQQGAVGEFISFRASSDIAAGEEMCIEYSQASNLEFMIRYGFKVEDNPYGARHFELSGEPLQSYCPPIILRYDLPEVVANATVDCHRQARYLAFEQAQPSASAIHQVPPQGGKKITDSDKLQQDIQIYNAIQNACLDLYKELETPKNQPKLVHYEKYSNDPVTHALVHEIRNERKLAQKCVDEFYARKIRHDLVAPVNTDTVEIATRIATEILGKYSRTRGSGGGGEVALDGELPGDEL